MPIRVHCKPSKKEDKRDYLVLLRKIQLYAMALITDEENFMKGKKHAQRTD